MKRFVSIVLAIMMIASMFTTVSADYASVKDVLDHYGFDTSSDQALIKLTLPTETLASKRGMDDYQSSLVIKESKEEPLHGGIGVDFKTTLNMQPVRDFLEGIVIATIKGTAAEADFNGAGVESKIGVTITYDDETLGIQPENENDRTPPDNGDINSVAKNTFNEVSREYIDANKILIMYKNNNDLKVSGLIAENSTHLNDITFTLEDLISYNEPGYHNINVTMQGTTTLKFGSGDRIIEYEGSASYIVSAETTHALEVIPAIPATCTATGLTEGVRCDTHDDCLASGIVKPVEIGMIPHSKRWIGQINPQCYENGVAGHYMCEMCKQDFSTPDNAISTDVISKDDLNLGKSDHTEGAVLTAAIDATCTTIGVTASKKCTNYDKCKYIFPAKKSSEALGHDPVTVTGSPATCTTAGLTDGSICQRVGCGITLVAQKPIPATGHSFGNWVITPATEDDEGSKTRTCANDHTHIEMVVIPKLQHNCVISEEDAVITKAATCTEAGTQQNYCACGKPVGEPVVIPAKGHSANVGHVAKVPATCTEKGIVEHWTCENCGGLFADAARTKKITNVVIDIDIYAHPESQKLKLRGIPATCAKDGLSEGEMCAACNVITTAQTIISKDTIEHTREAVPQVPAGCETAGIKAHVHCKVCDKDFENGVEYPAEHFITDALGHDYDYKEEIYPKTVIKAPTKTSKGRGKVHCKRDFSHYNEIDLPKELPDGYSNDKKQHPEIVYKVVTEPTCNPWSVGYEQGYCISCGEPDGEPREVQPSHNLKKIKAVDFTCHTEGVAEYWRCVDCNKLFEDEDATKPIDRPKKTGKRAHEWSPRGQETEDGITYNVKECNECHERVRNKVDDNNKLATESSGGFKDERDKRREESYNEDKAVTGEEISITTDMKHEEIGISVELEQRIQQDDTDTAKASEDKIVFDVVIEKISTVTEYRDDNHDGENDIATPDVIRKEKEIISESENLEKIIFNIPSDFIGANGKPYVDFVVYRRHVYKDEHGTLQTDMEPIRPSADTTQERIEFVKDGSGKIIQVVAYVKKFSEYALVGYEAIVNPDPTPDPTPTVSSGGSATLYTVKFNANGGTVVDSIRVKRGAKITAPETTREGYVLEGWYTDLSYKNLYDFDSIVLGNITLYAKWVEASAAGCPGTAEGGCPAVHFADVDTSAWYHLDVDYVVDNGLMNGVAEGEFAPNSTLTRAMLVTVLYRAEGAPEAEISGLFADVATDSYYEDAVAWAQANGIVKGYSDTAFGPDDNILREQIAAIMHRYAQYKGYDVSVGENTNILSYTDAAEISEYAVPAMQYAVGSGLLKGKTESTLNPKDNTTRAEIAAILHRFFEAHK